MISWYDKMSGTAQDEKLTSTIVVIFNKPTIDYAFTIWGNVIVASLVSVLEWSLPMMVPINMHTQRNENTVMMFS